MERLTSWLPREDEIIINEEESILSSKGCITKDEERQIKKHLVSRLFEYEETYGDGIDWMDYIIDVLPNNYPDGDVWSNGSDEILCKSETVVNTIADLIEALYRVHNRKDVIIHTGYYDPEEDERNNEEDQYTGWWYVNIE